MKQMQFTLTMAASLIAAATICTRAAVAQSALGGGDVLDRNLGVGQGIRNPESGVPNFRDRNLLVTGDVAGGRGFRGAVGYTAEGDFRGRLGSNDTFGFRADSALSSPQLFSLGSTYDQLRFGQNIGLIEYRRAGSAAPEAIIAQNPISVGGWVQRQRMDRQVAAASLALSQQQLVEPRVIGTSMTQDGQLLLFNASSIRGVTLEPAQQNLSSLGLSTFDAARVRQDIISGITPPPLGMPFETRFQLPASDVIPGGPSPTAPTAPTAATPPNLPGGAPTAPGAGSSGELPNAAAQRIDARIQRDYQRILESVADRYASLSQRDAAAGDSQSTLQQLSQDYSTLRDRLAGRIDSGIVRPTLPNQPIDNSLARASDQFPIRNTPADQVGSQDQLARADGQGTQPGTPSAGTLPSGTLPPGSGPPGTIAPSGTQTPGLPDRGVQARGLDRDSGIQPGEIPFPAPREGDEPKPVPSADFRAALRHGERIENLSEPMQDRFNELMATAEQKLREGDYFVAERRFERALRFAPGHPLASVGAGHAQLGAGLYLSSSLTLRTLLARHPEMIDATYAAELLPQPDRMQVIIEALQARLAEEDARDRAGYAFLLAYVGHQTGQRELIVQGLDVMAEADPQNTLLPLLRDIWLAPEEQGNAAGDGAEPQHPTPEK